MKYVAIYYETWQLWNVFVQGGPTLDQDSFHSQAAKEAGHVHTENVDAFGNLNDTLLLYLDKDLLRCDKFEYVLVGVERSMRLCTLERGKNYGMCSSKGGPPWMETVVHSVAAKEARYVCTENVYVFDKGQKGKPNNSNVEWKL